MDRTELGQMCFGGFIFLSRSADGRGTFIVLEFTG